jgi:hypothetical protein
MAFFIGPRVVSGSPTSIHDSAENALGTKAVDNEGNEYIYLKGVASVIAGSWVAFDENYETVGLDTDVAATMVSMVAVAMAAVVADKYGWFLIDGSAPAGAATVLDGGKVFPTATVFICDDTGTAGQQVMNAIWRSADASSLATVEIHNPFVGVNVA